MKNTINLFVILFILDAITIQVQGQGVSLANQQWMSKNLDAVLFRNGDAIMYAKNDEDWQYALEYQIPAYCFYNYDESNDLKFGKIYNWYAITDYRGLAPIGWRIPTAEDFEQLVNYLGRSAGIDLKSFKWISEIYKSTTNIDQTNPGFNALPGGFKLPSGPFGYLNECGTWWTCTLHDSFNAKCLSLLSLNGGFVDCCKYSSIGLSGGASVRCIREN
jgi:uncharacterized protein (TIGR02145 family)